MRLEGDGKQGRDSIRDFVGVRTENSQEFFTGWMLFSLIFSGNTH